MFSYWKDPERARLPRHARPSRPTSGCRAWPTRTSTSDWCSACSRSLAVWLLIEAHGLGPGDRLGRPGAARRELPRAECQPGDPARVGALSGGLAGLAGAGEVAGLNHRLEAGITQDLGYTAILVVSLGLLRPGSRPSARVLVGRAAGGGTQLQVQLGLPAAMAGVLLWAILYGMINAQNLAERWRAR